MSEVPKLYGLVLAGGRSRRMGSDKALLARDGHSQLAHTVDLLERFTAKAFVSTRKDQADEPERARFAQIIDRYDDLGPIAGILSAMAAHPAAAWLVLACDLPNVDALTLETLINGRDTASPFTAYRSSHNDLPEPLCAIFEPAARKVIDSFVAKNITCPRKMMIRSGAHLLTQPNASALDNINTPEDLERSTLQVAS